MTNLFKKAAVFTDIHWGLKSNSIQHNTDCTNFVDWFIETARREGCETCLFLGDWNHNRAAINLQTLQFGLRGLERISQAFEHVYFIPGNHDLFYRDKRDIHSVEWAKHLPNVTLVNDWFSEGEVTIAPWIVGDEWRRLESMSGKYLFGHFELPHFYMNSFVEMPDHGELKSDHLKGYERVFSGHFHKRQTKSNITYIGNAFPHNFADSGDDDRGMMILSWGQEPQYRSWPNAPKFRSYTLSQVLDEPKKLLLADSYVRITLDIAISFEEASFIREKLIPEHQLRELTLIPIKTDLSEGGVDMSNVHFESIDNIVQTQIEELQEGDMYDKKLLLEIYRNL
jgi:DNA repair exonuclease SbcCD nuclease subunit